MFVQLDVTSNVASKRSLAVSVNFLGAGAGLNATTAFRAPNIDDIGKIFESEPGLIVVPNNDLKPEYAYGGELGVTVNLKESIIFDGSAYYTYLDNALVRKNFAVAGVTVMEYDGGSSEIQAIQNASKSWIYGFEAGLKVQFLKDLKFTTQYSYVHGVQEETPGVELPVRHVAPVFGNAHLVWRALGQNLNQQCHEKSFAR